MLMRTMLIPTATLAQLGRRKEMIPTLGAVLCCPYYCGGTFYLDEDLTDHLKITHFDFGCGRGAPPRNSYSEFPLRVNVPTDCGRSEA
jgi:hypothetical protein